MKPTLHIPVCHLIAGPNGAGKSTFALEHLPVLAKCTEFVNADLIAAGLSPLDPTRSALRAGRLVLERIKEFSLAKKTFGFESTLSGRGYLSTLAKLKKGGFRVALYYLWLPSPVLKDELRSEVTMFPHPTSVAGSSARLRISPPMLRSLTSFFSSTHPLAPRRLFFLKQWAAFESRKPTYSRKSHHISTCHENAPPTHPRNFQSHEESRGKSCGEAPAHGRSDGCMERRKSR